MVVYRRYTVESLGANEEKEIVALTPKTGERIILRKLNFTSTGSLELKIWHETDLRYVITSALKEDINYGIELEIAAEPGETIKLVAEDKSGSANTITLVYEYERTPA